ncbi:MAG: 1-deoxy-D-xylulose-5-phosphate synthase [Clostridiales bacterium]|nr:1-deoxy-D-xylulose-5-phosphate synthase [Clostridiales bacterium]
MNLAQIKTPDDIRNLSFEECEVLADDIRTKIIQTVSQNGGHLSSNLGIVEITLALHRVFHMPEDKIIFDVGHQTYAHKLITGRYDQFHTLRTYGGLSGFPRKSESPYDCFEAGHASTAISAALGFARARDAKGESDHVVAVVGDGALTGGMCYEALNDCGNAKTRLIVLLNDNEMSIAKNVGALSQHLSSLRASRKWNKARHSIKNGLSKVPLIGKPLVNLIHAISTMAKSLLVSEGFFPALGFRYLGPIDGNDQQALEHILRKAKNLKEPVVVHCVTKKGYGFNRAEQLPEEFHGTSAFYLDRKKHATSDAKSFGSVANEELIAMARDDSSLQVVTAAMPLGTGTHAFAKTYPGQFFDVGIAEEHAVTMCAGMASGGMKPYFFVYSTFLQRGYDQVLHDVCIQKLPVKFLLDRAGISNEDGQSHQGLYDFAYLRHIPGMTVLAPADEAELRLMIRKAHQMDSPCAIRYPKNVTVLPEGYVIEDFHIGKWLQLSKGTDAVLLATGSMTAAALRVAELLSGKGVSLRVINASTIKPLDNALLAALLSENIPVFTLEEHVRAGGFGSAVLEFAAGVPGNHDITLLAVDDVFVQHGDHAHLLADVGLDDNSIMKTILCHLGKEDTNDA